MFIVWKKTELFKKKALLQQQKSFFTKNKSYYLMYSSAKKNNLQHIRMVEQQAKFISEDLVFILKK